MRRNLIFFLMLGMAILFAQDIHAQTRKKTGATITGTVLDSNGKPVANASVTCETSSGMKPRAVHTDKNGKFFITGLKQESYDLRARGMGRTPIGSATFRCVRARRRTLRCNC